MREILPARRITPGNVPRTAQSIKFIVSRGLAK
jgi:hypothetical protein